jgi:peptidoglycan/LPS O-acetylase OafA/YrhL
LLLGFALLCFVGLNHAFYFVIWLMGAWIALLKSSQRSRSASWIHIIACLMLFSAALLAARSQVLPVLRLNDLLVGGSFGLLVLSLLSWNTVCKWGLYHKLASGLAGFSYSLYVFHLPIIVFLAAFLLSDSRWQPTFPRVAFGFFLLISVAFITFLLSRLTEVHTDVLRRFLVEWGLKVDRLDDFRNNSDSGTSYTKTDGLERSTVDHDGKPR